MVRPIEVLNITCPDCNCNLGNNVWKLELAGLYYCVDCAQNNHQINVEDFMKKDYEELKMQTLEQKIDDFVVVLLEQQKVIEDLKKTIEVQKGLIEKLCQLANIPF